MFLDKLLQKLKAGAVMVDAPVSGGVGGAEAGTLTFMVGGRTPSNVQNRLETWGPILSTVVGLVLAKRQNFATIWFLEFLWLVYAKR